MFIDFEGIDGSGKTTLSNRLAQRLRRLGYRVTHAREGGELQARASRRIRELTRDARLLELSPRAEFLLNLARDAQQVEEIIKPALERGEVCITDRYLPSPLALGQGGRGLERAELEAALPVASQGIWPDLIVLVDVDPHLARLRKRLGKLQEGREGEPPSRKGLAGCGLSARVRESFLALAGAEPSRWLVVENGDQPLGVLEQRLLDAVVARLEGREPPVQPIVPPSAAPELGGDPRPLGERFFALLDALEAREPALAAHLLAGLRGLPAHRRRLAFAERFPKLVARGLRGLDDDESFALRELLKDRAPAEVALGLPREDSPRVEALRRSLLERVPRAVAEGLAGDGTPGAWALRNRALARGELAAVLAGLREVDSPRAWALREIGLERSLDGAVATSLQGLAGPRADGLREALLQRDRLAALRSLTGLDTPLAQRLREELLDRAPRAVMQSLAGVDSAHAHGLRERIAPLTPEALESLEGLDGERAWALRERHASRWPAAALASLGAVAGTERGQALVAAVVGACPGQLLVLRAAYAASMEGQRRPERTGKARAAEEPPALLEAAS